MMINKYQQEIEETKFLLATYKLDASLSNLIRVIDRKYSQPVFEDCYRPYDKFLCFEVSIITPTPIVLS